MKISINATVARGPMFKIIQLNPTSGKRKTQTSALIPACLEMKFAAGSFIEDNSCENEVSRTIDTP
jgi:hypothetical protein